MTRARGRPSARRLLAAAALPSLAAAAPAAAQPSPPTGRPVTVEARADLLAARETTVHGGLALLWPVGRSVRVGVQGGAGLTGRDAPPAGADRRVASGRAELVARFELDPYRERRWGLYGAAGGGVLAVRGRTGEPVVFAAVGAERRTSGRLAPAVEVGLGGGVRVALVARLRR